MPRQNRGASFTPRVSKGSAEKRRVQMAPEARFRPVDNRLVRLMVAEPEEEIRQNLGLA